MKKKLKKLKNLLFICLIVITSSCTEEKDFVNENNHKNIKLEQKKFNELIKSYSFIKSLKRIPKKKNKILNTLGRTIFEEKYGFTIIDAPVKIIEKDGNKYYTIQIITDNNTENKLENLVLYENPNNEEVGYIIRYNCDKSNVKTEEEIKQNGIKEVKIITTDTTANTNPSFGKFIVISYFYSACDLNPYNCYGSVCGFNYFQETIWVSDNFSTVETIGVGSNSGGGGGGGTNNETPNDSDPTDSSNHGNGGVTSPVDCPNCPILDEEIIDPCQKMTFLKNDAVFRQKMVILKNAAQQWNFEKLFTVNDDPTPNTVISQTDNFDYGEFSGTAFNPSATWVGDENIKGIIHSHYEGLLSIFSPQDLFDLYNTMSNPVVTNDFFYGVVNTSGEAYILQIKDRQAFLNFGLKYLSSPNRFKDFELEQFFKKFSIKPYNSSETNELNFVKMLKNLNIGLNIYKANSNFTNYEKLEYENNQVLSTSCN